MIPRGVAEQLKLVAHNLWQTNDYQNVSTGYRAVYRVRISFWQLAFNIDMVETDGIAIIGRDVLNRFTTTLHGRQTQLEIK